MLDIVIKGQAFVDALGRERIFNGINMVFKGAYREGMVHRHYIPDWDDKQFKWLQNNGFNIIRLGIVWDAIEHEMGQYNEDYLNWVEKMLDLCEAHGIYAFLDMHQDLYSEAFGGGAPRWATLTGDCDHMTGNLWSDAYIFSDAVNTAYHNFWLNKEAPDGIGLQDHYATMWIHILERFKDHKALIGFDVLNEPFAGEHSQEIMGTLLGAYSQVTGQDLSIGELMEAFGDIDEKHALLQKIDDVDRYSIMTEQATHFVEKFDKGHLTAFYNKMTGAIRSVTDRGIIMQENCYFSNMGVPCSLTPIMYEGQVEPLQAFSPHGYDLVIDTPHVVEASNNRITAIYNRHSNLQQEMNVPVLVGEWGGHSNYGEGLYHIKHILNYFDEHKWSHTYWCYYNGHEEVPVMDVLKRPYPQAVAGDIIRYHYEESSQTFTLDWLESIEASTEIYLPSKPSSIIIEGDYTMHTISHMSDAVIIEIYHQSKGERRVSIKL